MMMVLLESHITVADDDNADGLNDGSTTYQVVDVDVTTATNIKHQKWRHILRCNPQEIGISLKRSPRAMAMAGSFYVTGANARAEPIQSLEHKC